MFHEDLPPNPLNRGGRLTGLLVFRDDFHRGYFYSDLKNKSLTMRNKRSWNHGGAVSSVRVRDPPPLRALLAHLVTKGQWLLAVHRGNVSAPGARRASFWTRAPPLTF